jgi:hypothetical protein
MQTPTQLWRAPVCYPVVWGTAGGARCTKIVIAAAIALAAITAPSGAHAQYKGIMGAGTRSCGDWLQYRSNNPAAAYQPSAWIDGYISGFNVASPDSDFLTAAANSNGLNSNALNAWVDNYCRSKPLDVIATAATALMQALKAR